MSLRTDGFVQTMLYGSLFYNTNPDEMPSEGFKIYDDGTMSYRTRKGFVREIEVTEPLIGTLDVKIYDVTSNDLLNVFSMHYVNLNCDKCNSYRIHAKKNNRLYCTECGTYAV